MLSKICKKYVKTKKKFAMMLKKLKTIIKIKYLKI